MRRFHRILRLFPVLILILILIPISILSLIPTQRIVACTGVRHEPSYQALIHGLKLSCKGYLCAGPERTVRTASLTQVRQPIYTTSVARWKHFQGALAGLFEALPRLRDYPKRPF